MGNVSDAMQNFFKALEECSLCKMNLSYAGGRRKLEGYGVTKTSASQWRASQDLLRSREALAAARKEVQAMFQKLTEEEQKAVRQRYSKRLEELGVEL